MFRIAPILIWVTVIVVLIGIVSHWTNVHAQEANNNDLQKADKFFQEQKWQQAAKAYEKIAESAASNGMVWFRMGLSYHYLQQYEKAISAYKKAENFGFAQQRTRYNLACANSLLGKKDQAFAWMDKALGAGFSGVKLLKTDSDLTNIRDDDRFAKVLKRADKNSRPCEYDPKHREFDFWVGEWDVYNKRGQKVGTNIITKDLNGCLIFEHWTSAGGGSGKSMNYYDPGDGKWKQNWVAAGGGVVRYEGEVKDGTMHFKGESIRRDGTKELARVVLEPISEGRVHHLIEHSKDGGKTWYVYFDATYVPKERSDSNGTANSK
ncbi:tetratricopeptide repeat protein [candidate division KSB1 bacterium]|nr:tetratricopeptide repeat protein [candidate division KSB1 bacterium]